MWPAEQDSRSASDQPLTGPLPSDLRQKYGIQEGDSFRVIDLDGIFVLTPMAPMVPELAREIEKARLEAGLSIDELLLMLREERQKYNAA